MATKLDYVSGDSIIPEGAFKISPSSVDKFFSRPHEWYTNQILDEETFAGNTSSVLGTIVHFIAEEFAKTQNVDKVEIAKFIAEQREKGIPDVDMDHIETQWTPMGQALIDYMIKAGLPQRSEELISAEVLPGVYAAGSCDAVHGTTLVDYKTTSKLTADTYIPQYYKYQLLTYAWIYTQMGVQIDRIRIVWITQNAVGRISPKTGKPMKDYPATVTEVTEVITQEDLDFIESILKLIGETYLKHIEDPSLDYLLFKDYRLKENNVS